MLITLLLVYNKNLMDFEMNKPKMIGSRFRVQGSGFKVQGSRFKGYKMLIFENLYSINGPR